MRLREAPEVMFLRSPVGVAAAGAVSVAIAAGLIAWARRGEREERQKRKAMLAAATGATALSLGFIEVSRREGWVRGTYFEMPTLVQLAFNGPVSIASFTLVLAGYRAITSGARHPYWIYGALAAGFAPMARLGGAWELERGYYRIGNGWRLAYNGLMTQPIMWSPVLLYEGLNRGLPERRRVPVS